MKAFKFISLLLIIFLCTGCPIESKYPISSNNNEFDSQILGYWVKQNNTDGFIYFFMDGDKSLKAVVYGDNRNEQEKLTNSKKQINNKIEIFDLKTTIIKNHYLVCAKLESKDDFYYTFEYNFDKTNTMFLNNLSVNDLVKNKEFANTKEFFDYVKYVFDNYTLEQIFMYNDEWDSPNYKSGYNKDRWHKLNKKEIFKTFDVKIEI